MAGVVTRPAQGPRASRVILFCQAGLQNKGGVGDFFRWLGDRLAGQGYTVVRFDQLGTGDSPGEVAAEVQLSDLFVKIQSGAFLNDTLDAISWVRRTYPGQPIVLWGQCGGCISALMACAEEPEGIEGLILLALPVLFSPTLDRVREFDAIVASKGYLRKLLQPRSYMRLLTGKSEYQLMGGAMRTMARKGKKKLLKGIEALKREPGPDHGMFNWTFWDNFKDVMRAQKPVLFLMARLDNETPEFNDEFKVKVLDRRAAFRQLCQVEYLDQADHSLMLEDARVVALNAMLRWLGRL